MPADPLPLREAHGLSPEMIGALAQAASVCFEHNGHVSGREMDVDGETERRFAVLWDEISDLARRSWADLQEATEWGAAGVAVALLPKLSDMIVLERSCKGTSFDYWLGSSDDVAPLFQKKGRMEVSGILNGSRDDLARRTREKVRQIEKYSSSLTGVVVVVDFGEPRSRVVVRWKR